MQTAWFIAIALLWALYLVLEGFDFGVGMLLRRVRDDAFDRRAAIHTIGPTWAANEVWLVIAVVAMFGAFPGWYAAWASTFYLPLTVALLALIARNTSIELLGKRDDEAWRRGWERVLFVASFVAPFCWGLIWTAALDGVALRGPEAVGGPLEVLTPVALLGGLTLVVLCRALGAAFLALRTEGEVGVRAARELRRTAPVAAVLVSVTVIVTTPPGIVSTLAILAALAFATLALAARGVAAPRHPGRTFAAGCLAIALVVVGWFAALHPAGLNGADGAPGLALDRVVAGDYTLTLMTILAGLLLPLLLAVQAWSYWLFRERVTRAAVGAPRPSPVDLIARVAEKRGW
jgi:cytochrome d ubiquinol oxidase subunit II